MSCLLVCILYKMLYFLRLVLLTSQFDSKFQAFSPRALTLFTTVE